MTKGRHISNLRLTVAFILGLLTLFNALVAPAQRASAAPLNSIPTVSVLVPAGGSATVHVQAIALQPGATLPQGQLSLAAQPLPADSTRIALYYGLNWGYIESAPQQVALAIWYTQDGAWHGDDHAIADRIVQAATSAPGLPSWNVTGRSALSLIAQGRITVSGLQLTPGALSSMGSGTVTVENTSSQDLQVYLPYGTVFSGAAGSAIVWASSADQAPPQATQQPAATETIAAQPTATEQAQPPAATDTPVSAPPASTPGSIGKVAYPTVPAGAPPSQPSEVAKPAAATDAPQPPSATVAPAATDTPQPAATATAVPQSGQDGAKAGVSQAPPPAPTQHSSSGQPVKKATPTQGQSHTQSPPSSQGSQDAPVAVAVPPDSAPQQAPATGSSSAPVLPTPTATAGSATKGGDTAPPPPVSTAGANDLPGAQPTGAAPIPPGAQATGAVPIPSKATFTPTLAAKPTPILPPTLIVPPTDKGAPPTPLPPAPTKEIVITTEPAPSAGGGGPAGPPNNQSGGGTAGPGNPVTGGGPSALPTWLALFSAMMMLGGWSLRKMASSSDNGPVPIEVEEDDEEI